MKLKHTQLALAIASLGVLALYGCGGGGSLASSSATISGVAATGAALANAPVTITNTSGNSPCVETSITTSALGSYTCTLKSGQTAPFFVVITDPTGDKAPLVSIATSTPAAGTPLTVNATPLTTAIVAQLNNGDALSLVPTNGSPAAVVIAPSTLTTNLNVATTNVLAQLAPVLTAISAPSGYNPFTTSITAATATGTGNTADQVLDIVKVSTDPATGALALSTISHPTPVALASATTTGSTLPQPTLSASDLGAALSTAAAAFNSCFADPVSVRVISETSPAPTTANGGPEVNSISTACQNIVTTGTVPSTAPRFKHNGYSAGQFFYNMMKDSSMTGAKFSAPEVMAFYPANSSSTNANEQVDRAIINVRYIDNAGNPGNFITVASNFPGTATASRNTNWWLTGNQQGVDITVKAVIRRVEQVNTGTLASNAATSGFQSGLQFIVSAVGPNSANYSSARITGPGLPTTGLWYFNNSGSTQTYMDLSSYRQSTPSALTPPYATGAGCTSNCPNYWFGKTTSLTATTYITNPTNSYWAQGTDGSFNGSSGTRPVKGDKYTVSLYNGTTLFATVTKTLLTDPLDPKVGSQLPWNTGGTQSVAALTPSNTTLNGQVSSLTLDWSQNTAAQQMGSVAATTTNAKAYSNSTTVARGATNITITAPSPYLFTSTTAPDNFRSLLFNYRMLDGSSKSAVYSYN